MIFELNFQAGKTSVIRLNRNICEFPNTFAKYSFAIKSSDAIVLHNRKPQLHVW